jgi:hypothetical protein
VRIFEENGGGLLQGGTLIPSEDLLSAKKYQNNKQKS